MGPFVQYVPLRAHTVPNVKISEAFYLKFVFGILLDFNAPKEDVPIPFLFFSFKLKYKLTYFLHFQWQCCCVSGHAVSDVTSPADGSPCHVCIEPAEFPGRDRRHPAAAGALRAGAGRVQPAPAARPAAQHHRGHQPGHFAGEAHLLALVCARARPGTMTEK